MITDPWLLDPVCACCKNMAWATEQDMLISDCEKCKNYREYKENSQDTMTEGR